MALLDYLVNKPVIETRRLVIRPMKKEDVPALKEWIMEPSLYRYWGKGPGVSDRNPERMFEKLAKPVRSFHPGIEEKASGRVIGEIWVYRIENNRMAWPSASPRPIRTMAMAGKPCRPWSASALTIRSFSGFRLPVISAIPLPAGFSKPAAFRRKARSARGNWSAPGVTMTCTAFFGRI